ncbi:hypothetical protein KM043_008093 [Ampulex compressa]|nr:hypothetical protein KM043_008093 [Ampulex compressa]
MSNSFGRIYCAEQINIPPGFPHILKLYAKAAVRTQPYDLLRWTVAYFRALSNGEVPPVKERLEYPPFAHPSGITPGYLRTLLNRFGRVEKVCLTAILKDWQGMSLTESTLYQILVIGGFLNEKECEFYKFLSIACGFLGNNLLETMIYVCELLTDEPEGGSAMIPLRIFLSIYRNLADLDCSGEPRPEQDDEIMETQDLFRPCGRTSLSEVSSSTLDSRIYRFEATVEEEGDTGLDIGGEEASSERRLSWTLRSLRDCGDDTKRREIDVPHEGHSVLRDNAEIETDSMDRRRQEEKSEATQSADEIGKEKFEGYKEESREDQEPAGGNDDDVTGDKRHVEDEFESEFELGEGEGEEGEEMMGEAEEYVPLGLENILQDICECMEPVRELGLVSTPPPPPDPLQEFAERMKEEVQRGHLKTIFRIPGIGPSVSQERVTAVGLWLAECARRQEGLVGPRNIRHFLCPNLEDDADQIKNDLLDD